MTKKIPKLHDGEKVLLAAIDRVLAHSKESAKKLSGQRDELMASVQSSERCRVNYLSALQKLALKNLLATTAPVLSSSGRRAIKVPPSLYSEKTAVKKARSSPPASSSTKYPPAAGGSQHLQRRKSFRILG